MSFEKLKSSGDSLLNILLLNIYQSSSDSIATFKKLVYATLSNVSESCRFDYHFCSSWLNEVLTMSIYTIWSYTYNSPFC